MVDIDFSQAPFSLLDEAGRSRVRRGADLAYFDAGKIILDSGQPGEFVFVIHKGEVAELDMSVPESQRRIGHYTSGDIFGAISILNGKSRYRFQTEQESLCYLLPKSLFLTLCEEAPSFGEFFQQRLAEKTRRLLERRAEGGVTMAGFMLARITECMREPLMATPETTLAEAAALLNTHHADSLLVSDGKRCGMVTKTDLLNAAVIEGVPTASPVLGIAHFELISARAGAYLFEALISMTRHEVARVVVMEEGRVLGVVELTDVLSFFSSRAYVVGLQLEQAETLDELAQASARLPELIRGLMAQGVKLRFAMELMAALNGRIMSKAFQFVVPEPCQSQSCLLVMGSEGRGEQILKTDQDNALILPDGSDWPDVAETMPRLTEALLTLGYPPCPGNIMVSNPDWVATESAWRGKVARWASRRDGASLMNLAIMLDAHAVAGNVALLDGLREHLFEHCSGDELFLSQFARAALRFSTPLTMFGSVKRPEHGIDIKKGGIFPIVHGVRTLVMERRIASTSTFARLNALVADGRLDAEFAEDLEAAMSLFAELRLKQQLAQLDGAPMVEPNRIVVQRLSSLERDLLREALHTVKEFKQRLSHRYHLEY
ncbi:putative nucleotidyltransferase substrate binding domain-containing protein [Halomonas shantousis]